ncbi:MAG TPA: ribonuclease catalytic domain-containing protein [Usitatibacter sp.]|nr:ribonuclease catalytic domain-containing protein [Usitatibacter sp.]
MKQVLFEEDGAFRVGTVLAEAGASFQVEAAHGKRSKVKAGSILLRFDGQPLASFMSAAQELAASLDPQFLWEVCGPGEFGFEDLAREYYGRAPMPQEATAVAIALHANPVHFYKRGKGRYQAAPEQNLKAALAGLEKKKRQQAQVDEWARELAAGKVPGAIVDKLDPLLFKPDKMSLEWRALDQAAGALGMKAPRVLAAAGALAGPEDYFLRRFAFEFFPGGLGFPPLPEPEEPSGLTEANVTAFSIDDEETTEIDDALSITREQDRWLVGIHIAAPALLFGARHPLEALARERLSTVYFPGGKVTMLPPAAVERASLAAGRRVPTASLYLHVDPQRMEVTGSESRLEWITVADNLRLAELDARLNDDAVARGAVEGPHGGDLLALWKLAKFLQAARGAGDEKTDRLDYTFRIVDGRVSIEPRRRGSPVDLLVSELMIHLNSTWGRWLADRGFDAIYRNQKGGKTRMETAPGTHEWLGVSHYAWSSSPLRRYVDLVNQRQLAALISGREPEYTRDDLDSAARAFEVAYEAYADHQRALERFWCLKYIRQEGLEAADATLIREDLVRIDGMPLVLRALGVPAAPPGERMRIAFGEVDLWEAHVIARYAGKASTIPAHAET